MGAADNTDKKLIFAADLGGTHLRAATVDRCGRIHSRFKQNTPQVADANAIVDLAYMTPKPSPETLRSVIAWLEDQLPKYGGGSMYCNINGTPNFNLVGRFHENSIVNSAMYVRAFTRNAVDAPATATMTPPTAGPAVRARL